MNNKYSLYENTAFLYDLDNRDTIKKDLEFYKKYICKDTKNILELACGTGRISIALAKEHDINITSVDLSEYMLDEFKKKVKTLDKAIAAKIKIIKENMVYFESDNKYNIILIPWRSFQYITDETEARSCLLQCYKHLENDGLFILQIFNPQESYSDWLGKKLFSYEGISPETGEKIVRSTENVYLSEEKQILHYLTKFEIHTFDGGVKMIEDLMKYKYYYKSQMVDILKSVGFYVKDFCYDFDFSIQNGIDMVFVCKKA